MEATYSGTRKVYEAANARASLVVAQAEDAPAPGPWLIEALKKK